MISKLEANVQTNRVGEMEPNRGTHDEEDETPIGIRRLRILMAIFSISLGDLASGSGRMISKSQIQRFTSGQRTDPTPRECHALARGLVACLSERCDSSYLFSE